MTPHRVPHDLDAERGTPVQSSKLFAPWRDERLEPVDHLAARRARGRVSAVSAVVARVGELDDRLPRRRGSTSSSSRTGVAFTIRSQPSASGGHSPRREKTRVSAGSAGASVAARPARADHAGARRASIPARISLVRVEAEHAAVAEDERVHGVALGLVARRDHRGLVRDRHVRAGEAERPQRRERAATASSTSNAE